MQILPRKCCCRCTGRRIWRHLRRGRGNHSRTRNHHCIGTGGRRRLGRCHICSRSARPRPRPTGHRIRSWRDRSFSQLHGHGRIWRRRACPRQCGRDWQRWQSCITPIIFGPELHLSALLTGGLRAVRYAGHRDSIPSAPQVLPSLILLRRSRHGPLPRCFRRALADIASLQQFWHISSTQLHHVPRLNNPQYSALTSPFFFAYAPLHEAAPRGPRLPRFRFHYPDVSVKRREPLRHGAKVAYLTHVAARTGPDMVRTRPKQTATQSYPDQFAANA